MVSISPWPSASSAWLLAIETTSTPAQRRASANSGRARKAPDSRAFAESGFSRFTKAMSAARSSGAIRVSG